MGLAPALYWERLASVGVFITMAAACDTAVQASPAKPQRALVVELAAIDHDPVARPIRGTGWVERKSQYDLAFKVGGVVTRVAAEVGAQVRKGQVLAAVESSELQALKDHADVTWAIARRELERTSQLYKALAVPAVQTDDAESAEALARARSEAAASSLRHTVLVAPGDGVIEQRAIDVGEVAVPGQVVFRVSGRERGTVVRVALSPRDALAVKVGDRASVTVDASPARLLTGQVSEVASSVTPGSGSLDVEIEVLGAEAAAWPSGLSAKVVIERVVPVAASVPLGALVDGQHSQAAVFIVKGDRAWRRSVEVSFLTGERAALSRGLEQDTAVVHVGADQLFDGAKVRTLP